MQNNYFELFQLPVGFQVDRAQLERSYQDILQQVHPDRQQNQELQQRLAARYAARVNDAYHCLRDPVRRAVYLLELQHIHIELEHSAVHDVAFLEQLMSWQETLEDIEQSRQHAASQEAGANADAMLSRIKQEIAEQTQQQEARFIQCYDKIMALRRSEHCKESSASLTAEVQDAVLHLRFLDQISHQVDQAAY